MRRNRLRIVAVCVVVIACVTTAGAQAAGDPVEQLRRLEERLDALERENAVLRGEIESLRRGLAPPQQQVPADDLTAVDVMAPVQASPVPAAPPIDLVSNPPAPGGKVFNPDIAVIGNFLGKAGDPNPFEERDSMAMEESEISFQAFVDPYMQARFYVAVSDEGAELEEGFVQFLALPMDLTARAGKLKASFGKVNLMHTHLRPWVDQPLAVANYFGEEGLRDSGISVSRLFPNAGGLFVEATAEVYRGNIEGVFEAEAANDFAWLGHVKIYRDLTESTNVEVGGSVMQGTLADSGGTGRLAGADLTFRYKPLERAIYRALVSRTEVIVADRDDAPESALGWYTSLDYQFARRWFAGIRLDRAERVLDPGWTDRGGSLTLTFWPSEFSQLRAQARRVRYGSEPWINELLMQVQFSIGAHGAHTF